MRGVRPVRRHAACTREAGRHRAERTEDPAGRGQGQQSQEVGVEESIPDEVEVAEREVAEKVQEQVEVSECGRSVHAVMTMLRSVTESTIKGNDKVCETCAVRIMFYGKVDVLWF